MNPPKGPIMEGPSLFSYWAFSPKGIFWGGLGLKGPIKGGSYYPHQKWTLSMNLSSHWKIFTIAEDHKGPSTPRGLGPPHQFRIVMIGRGRGRGRGLINLEIYWWGVQTTDQQIRSRESLENRNGLQSLQKGTRLLSFFLSSFHPSFSTFFFFLSFFPFFKGPRGLGKPAVSLR